MMTQKTLSVPEDLYNKLKTKKKNSETFPDLIERLMSEYDQREAKHTIMDLAGSLER